MCSYQVAREGTDHSGSSNCKDDGDVCSYLGSGRLDVEHSARHRGGV